MLWRLAVNTFHLLPLCGEILPWKSMWGSCSCGVYHRNGARLMVTMCLIHLITASSSCRLTVKAAWPWPRPLWSWLLVIFGEHGITACCTHWKSLWTKVSPRNLRCTACRTCCEPAPPAGATTHSTWALTLHLLIHKNINQYFTLARAQSLLFYYPT